MDFRRSLQTETCWEHPDVERGYSRAKPSAWVAGKIFLIEKVVAYHKQHGDYYERLHLNDCYNYRLGTGSF